MDLGFIFFAAAIVFAIIVIWKLKRKKGKGRWLLFKKDTINNGVSGTCYWAWDRFTGASSDCYTNINYLIEDIKKRIY